MSDHIAFSDLKSILHSKRANIYYLEHCRLLVNGGRVEYITDEGKRSLYWNIPIANTTTVLLGTGTSVTQAAMRELAKAGVLVGFCGGGGTPLFSANEIDIEVAWFSPQSEYRPTEYLQHWVRFWFDDELRLAAAKSLQLARLGYIRTHWTGQRSLKEQGFDINASILDEVLATARKSIENSPDLAFLLTHEARLTKQLYKMAAGAVDYGDFVRSKRGSGKIPPIACSTTATIWHTDSAQRRPGCWDCRMVWQSCTGRPGAVAWYSMRRIWSRTRSSSRKPSCVPCGARASRSSAMPASTA